MEALLAELGADGSLLVQLPAWHYADAALPAGATSLPLRGALARCYDLRQPKPELLSLLHAKLAAAAGGGGIKLIANGSANGASNGTTHNSANGVANGTANGVAHGGKKGVANGTANGAAHGGKKGKRRPAANGTAAAAAGVEEAHGPGELCGQGCVVDKLEVREG